MTRSDRRRNRPRVAVVGAGAVGSVFAAAVHDTGAAGDLQLYGRSARPPVDVAAEGRQSVAVGPVLVGPPPGLTVPVEWVLLAVKAHQTTGAAGILQALAGPGSRVLVLQNGVDGHLRVADLVPSATVVPAVVWCPAERSPAGVIQRGPARLLVGDDPEGRAVAELLKGSRVAVTQTDDLRTAMWRKLVLNAVTGLLAVTGRRSDMFHAPGMPELARRLAEECVAVGRAEGALLDPGTAGEVVASLMARPSGAGSSILDDRLAGRPLEWEARNAVVQRLGARHGVATPVSDVVVPLLAAVSGAALPERCAGP